MAKMTPEQRMLFLEQQRLAEEEMRKKKEDMLIAYLKVGLFPNNASNHILEIGWFCNGIS